MSIKFKYIDEENGIVSIAHNNEGRYYIWCKELPHSTMVYLPTEVEKIDELIQFLESYKQTLENGK